MRLELKEANSEAARTRKEFEDKAAKAASSHNKELGALRDQVRPRFSVIVNGLKYLVLSLLKFKLSVHVSTFHD